MEKVKIILNGGWGTGFSENQSLGFDKVHLNQELAQAVLAGDEKKFDKIASNLQCDVEQDEIDTDEEDDYGLMYCFDDLYVVEVPKMTKYRITEYDGQENLETEHDIDWEVA